MTKIEWADETWNPITGCTPISEGCQNCYAKRIAKRLAGRYGYPREDPFRVTFHEDRLHQPKNWRPRRIFVCSMGDLFHEDVADEWIKAVFDTIYRYRHHEYMILTKRPERLRDMIGDLLRDVYSLANWREGMLPDHLQIGVTAENQKRADERIPILLQIPAAVRFVSVEPMLGYIDLDKTCGKSWCWRGDLDWVICGAETGPKARPMQIDWAIDLKNQCKAANVPFFFKKASKGDTVPDELNIREFPTGEHVI